MKVFLWERSMDVCLWDSSRTWLLTFKEHYSSRHKNSQCLYLLVATETQNWGLGGFKNSFIHDRALGNLSWDSSLSFTRTHLASALWLQNWYLGSGMCPLSLGYFWTSILGRKSYHTWKQHRSLKVKADAKCLLFKVFKFCWKTFEQEGRRSSDSKRSATIDSNFHQDSLYGKAR